MVQGKILDTLRQLDRDGEIKLVRGNPGDKFV